MHWIISLYHHRNVLWLFILILVVEILYGTIEVFFGSYAIHMKCSLAPRKSSWNSSRPKWDEEGFMWRGGSYDKLCSKMVLEGGLLIKVWWRIFKVVMILVLSSCLLWCSIRLFHRLQEWRCYQGSVPWLEIHDWRFQVPEETGKSSLFIHYLREVFLK